MKKALAFVCAAVMIVSAFAINNPTGAASIFSTVASAASNNGSCGENVKYNFNSSTGVLTISGSGAMADYAAYSDSPFAMNYSIKKIVIENGITSIGNNSFYSCSNVAEVSIPSSVKKIGEFAFCYCSGLKKVVIPNSVTEMDMYAFYACTSLADITLSSNLMSISFYAFGYCTALKGITIPSSVTSIGGYAFWYCTALDSIKIPNTVTEIGESAFKKCSALKDVTLSKKAVQIPDDMFRECKALTSVKIPEGVISIGENAFESCDYLSVVYIPKTIITINSGAFKNTSLKDIYYGSTEINWGRVVKTNCFDTKYTMHYTSTTSDVKLAAPVVTASNVASSGKIKLTWNEVSGAAKYKVYRSTSADGTYILMKTTEGTTCTHTSAVAGTRYYYKVRAITSGGAAGLYCEPISRICDCAKPEISLSSDSATGKIVISWKSVDGASSYKVYRSTEKDGTYSLIKTVNTLSYKDTTAEAGKKYYYKVKAISSVEEAASAYSSYKYRTCDLTAPVVTASLTSSGKPTLKWDAIDGAVSYKVYRSTSKTGTYKLLKTTTNTTFTNTTVDAATTYFYKVKAICNVTDGNSAYSSVVNIKTK